MRVKKIESNRPVSHILNEIADYLEIAEENSYKIETYRRASLIIKSLPYDITFMENLTAIKGIGDSLAVTIGEILNTGTCVLLEGLKRKYGRKNNNRREV